VDFGASTLLFSDAFDDPLSGWGSGSTPGGEVQYSTSALELRPSGEGRPWVWSTRQLVDVQNVVHLEATLTPSVAGYQGLLCTNNDELTYGAAVNSEGRWAFITLATERTDLLTTQVDTAWLIAPNVPTRFALDCAGTATGAFRMQLSLPERGMGVMYEGGSTGPDNFDRVGLFAEAGAPAYVLRVDDAAALGGTGTTP
jgi:hypothetical protein